MVDTDPDPDSIFNFLNMIAMFTHAQFNVYSKETMPLL